jgi:hypothetical protein
VDPVVPEFNDYSDWSQVYDHVPDMPIFHYSPQYDVDGTYDIFAELDQTNYEVQDDIQNEADAPIHYEQRTLQVQEEEEEMQIQEAIHTEEEGQMSSDEEVIPLPAPSRKRSSICTSYVVPFKRPRSNMTETSDLKGAHVVLALDVSDDIMVCVEVPQCLRVAAADIISQQKAAKVQIGLLLTMGNDVGESRLWRVSVRAAEVTEDFYEEGIAKLEKKIQEYTESGSNWRMVQIMEISLTIIRISHIMNRSGSSFLPSPEGFKHSKCTVNVKNDDNLCFLYSILSVLKYDSVPFSRFVFYFNIFIV